MAGKVDREAKLAALHARLADQVRELRTGEQWTAWLNVASRFHDYSFNNTLLILAQRPDATAVAGYRAWQALGRQVNKGEKGLQILAPVLKRTPNDDVDEPPAVKVAGYRVTHVWDVSQTSGTPLPAKPAPALLQGQAPDGLWDALATYVRQRGFTLERGDCEGANGRTNFADRTVRVRSDVDDAQAVKTLAHELAHIECGHTADGFDYTGCRGRAEAEAESVAYIVTAWAGLDAGAYTVPYVAGWAGGDVARVKAAAETVTRAARTILTTLEVTAAEPAPALV